MESSSVHGLLSATRFRRSSQDSNVLMQTPERRRSSSQSDATPRQGRLQPGANANTTNTAPHDPPGAESHPSKRLAFLPEKLLSSSSATSAQRSSRTHGRTESASTLTREATASPAPMASPAAQTKGHASPSKASTRTYDSKLVSREMHRLGTLAHLPSLTPTLTAGQSTASLAMPSAGSSNLNAGSSGDNPWAALHVHVLPLFNGEPLRMHLEDLNQLVKRHIATVVSAAPSKALATLEHDAGELISSGMVTLNSKLSAIEDEKLVSRVVELWGFFWDQVLPYVEGALLPLQTDPVLQSLYRTPKAHKPSSPAQNGMGSISSLALHSSAQIDVRTIALQAFRDRIILPAFSRLYARLTLSFDEQGPDDADPLVQPRLQQMLLVLSSQHAHRPASLTGPPQQDAGEAAVAHLLRAARAPASSRVRAPPQTTGAPSFVAEGVPRDRRGRIELKHRERSRSRLALGLDVDDEEGGETPRVGGVPEAYSRDREEFLESLRSPTEAETQGYQRMVFRREDTGPTEERAVQSLSQGNIMERVPGIVRRRDT